MENQQPEICIVGAGVAGAALAGYLGQHGIRVTIIEKNMAEQDRIVGELLQPGGVQQMKNMGLANLLEGFDAMPIKGYAIYFKDSNISIPYPEEFNKITEGRGFRNGKFIQKMREHILQMPNIRVIEAAAEDFILDENNDRMLGVKYRIKGEEESREIKAPLTVVCDGAYSVFRDKLSNSERQVSSYFLGILLKHAQLPYENFGHVILADPSPFLCYPISSEETRVLIDFPWEHAPRKSPELIQYLKETIAPQMPPQLLDSFLAAVDEGKFKVMPNHLMTAKPFKKSGAVLVGDSLNMRHPLTGGGMTVALTDVHELGKLILGIGDFSDASVIDNAIVKFYSVSHPQNASINILADALYGVMKDPELREACYDYLKKGGDNAAEPISLLSAKARDPKILMRHFISVALYGVSKNIGFWPTPAKMVQSYKMVYSAFRIITPLLMNEKSGLMPKEARKLATRVMN